MTLFIYLILVFIVAMPVWMIYGMPDLMILTYGIIGWCQNLFVRCLEYYAILKLAFLWTSALLLTGGFIYAIIKGAYGLIKVYRGIKRLPRIDRGLSVVLIKDDKTKVAFTHGLFKPRIYISTGLLRGLEKEEIKAVFLHELHHKRNMDPLRFFVVSLIRDTFFYLPIGGYIMRHIRSISEYEADDTAVQKSDGVLGLSTALLKLATTKNDYSVKLQPVSIRGFGSIEDRIRRIIEGVEIKATPPSLRSVIGSMMVILFMSLSLSVPLFASSAISTKGCNTEHCSDHHKDMVDVDIDSNRHCDKSAHKG